MRNQLIAALLSGWALFTLSCEKPGEANVDEKRTVRTHTEVVQLSKVSDRFQAPGTVRARTATVLSAKIVGQILSIGAREGDRVRQGQLLAEIDNREAATQLRRAEAAATEAQRACEEADRAIAAAGAGVRLAEANRDLAASTRKRYDVLRERHSISPHEYDEIDARYRTADLEVERARQSEAAAHARRMQLAARIEQAKAEVDAAGVNLGYSQITSPIDGIVTIRHADPGMLAAPGMPLLTLEDDRTYELEATLEESRVANVAIGQKVSVEIDALQNTTIDGRVREITPAADPATRTYTVKIQIATRPSGRTLRSGFFGRVFFPDGEREAVLISDSALVHRGQLEGVYVIQNNAALLRLVKTGKRYGQRIELISGITPGTRIVTEPTAEISDGVNVIDIESSRNAP